MESLSEPEKNQIIAALQQEVNRLERLEREYRSVRKPSNQTVIAICEEGIASLQARVSVLKTLLSKIKPEQNQIARKIG